MSSRDFGHCHQYQTVHNRDVNPTPPIEEKKKALKPKKKTAKAKEAPASNVINIMDALRKSVADELKSRKAG
ncbi:hypothetical protein A6U86_32315 [Rhizobium sp. AC27/96]|nr:hypothetical protein A6U86_32315 [Rhizobium sp. AC27/96]